MSSLRTFLNTPLAVGSRTLDARVVLAPMAGLGHVAMRQVIADFGLPGFLSMEMCNARAVPGENRHTSAVFRWQDTEQEHLVCQIFGGDPQVMALAAARIESEGLFGVDINMGCSVSAICSKGYGAALLRDPERAVNIVRTVRRAVRCPVMVKFRTGWDNSSALAVDLAKRFEDAGADLLTFHPRVAPDRRSRPPRWEQITDVVQAVSIPVLGNGDVRDAASCARMVHETGCAGVAIGRMAIARPWIFGELRGLYVPDESSFEQATLQLIARIWEHFSPERAIKIYKKAVLYIAANFVFGHALWPELTRGHDRLRMEENARRILGVRPQVASTPNAFLLTS